MSKLVLYDLLILWKSARAAFSRKRDLLLLAIAAVIGLLIAIERAGAAADALGALPLSAKAAMSAVAAFGVNFSAARRLRHLREESPVARHALRPGEAGRHALLWNLVPLCLMALLVVLSDERLAAAAAVACSYLVGMGLAAAQRALLDRLRRWWGRRRASAGLKRGDLRGRTRRARIVQLLISRTGLLGPRPAVNLIAFAGIGLSVGLGYFWLSAQLEPAAAGAIAGLLALLSFLFLLRTHPALLRYLLFLGSEPLLPALAAAALAGAFVTGLLLGMMNSAPASPAAMLAAAGSLLLLFLTAALLRTLHYATKSRQAAEIAIQIDLVAAGLAGMLALPLAALILVVRLWMLARHARALRYALP